MKRAYQHRTNRPCDTDCVMTPPALAKKIVRYFRRYVRPKAKMLEPCYGKGAFFKAMRNVEWDEIDLGRDFFERTGKFDWIITNPPWSQFSSFLAHSFTLAENVVMLIHIQQVFMPNRLRMAKFHKFGLKEIILLDTPKDFPQSGFQLGAVYWKKDYKGPLTIKDKQGKKFHNGRGAKSSRNYKRKTKKKTV